MSNLLTNSERMAEHDSDWMAPSQGMLMALPARSVSWLGEFSRRVHRDQRGSISIVTVFALLMFTMLLIMVVNVGTHVDDKLKMQNAADASAYSGGVIIARGMNGLAFSNHLLSDVFAMTAFLRESRDRNAESLVPPVLDAWRAVGQTLQQAPFEKFRRLGVAVTDKVPKEQEAVDAFGELSAGSARLTLPVFEYILKERLIGRFQRDLILMTPDLAQAVTSEVARRHGLLGSSNATSALQQRDQTGRGQQLGLLWRTSVMPVSLGDEQNPQTRTLPVIDPDPFEGDYARVAFAEEYLQEAIEQRRNLARAYLNDWNYDRLRIFADRGKMSVFFNLWRIATCAHLEELLTVEYPLTNLPMVMRRTDDGRVVERLIRGAEMMVPQLPISRTNDMHHPFVIERMRSEINLNDFLERNFQFVSVVYRKHLAETGPGLFKNPMSRHSDAQTFAQVMVFVPRPRKVLWYPGQQQPVSYGGTLGITVTSPAPPPGPRIGEIDPLLERWVNEGWPTHWDLLNQNWMVQLVPATARNLPQILGANPGAEFAALRQPSYGGVENRQLKRLSHH